MGYDLRLLAKSTATVPLEVLQSVMEECRFEVIDGEGADWEQLLVTSLGGHEICTLERAARRTMAREIDWLLDDLADRQPRSAANWAAAYLHSTRALYGCSFRSFGFSPAYAGMPCSVLWAIQSLLGNGILHVEGQGFSNEDGYQITWEFSDRVTGSRQMAVLGSSDCWHAFEMDIGDARSREAFKAGLRPFGAELLMLH
jgi:hypothetical protein